MEYKLIYVNRLGFNYKGYGLFEFIFADETIDLFEDVWGEGWLESPADGRAQPPEIECIKKVGSLQCKEYNMEVAQDSYYFSLADAKADVVALAWEDIDNDFDPKKIRLVFRFGENLTEIEKKLKSRGLKLNYEN